MENSPDMAFNNEMEVLKDVTTVKPKLAIYEEIGRINSVEEYQCKVSFSFF